MNCVECGKEFVAKTSNQKYCSQLCCGRAHHKRYRERQLICTCMTCGQKFHKRHNAKGYYCSRECSFLDKENNPMYIVHETRQKLAMARKEGEARQKEIEKVLKKVEAQQRAIAKRKEYISTHMIECKVCGEMFLGALSRKTCSRECRKKWENARRDGRVKRNGKPDYSITLGKLYTRDQGVCCLCGKPCNFNDYKLDDNGYFVVGKTYPSIDHIKPIAKGGLHVWDNVQLAHMECNSKKKDKYFDEQLPPHFLMFQTQRETAG